MPATTQIKFIYTMTVIRFKPDNISKDVRRTWGWYTTFDEADTAVMLNYGDMFESGYYQLAVVEKMESGALAMMKREWWYKASCNNGKMKVEKIDKPARYGRTVNFSMG